MRTRKQVIEMIEIIDFNESVSKMFDQMKQNDLDAIKSVELINERKTGEILKVSIIIEKDSMEESVGYSGKLEKRKG
jgi:hypothetical protein